MKRLILAGLLLGGCSGDRVYKNSESQLLANLGAKSMCSCIFVLKQDETWCTAWAREEPPLARHTVNRDDGEVETVVLGVYRARATWRSERLGCTLQ